MSRIHPALLAAIPFQGGFALPSPVDGFSPDASALGGLTGAIQGTHINVRLDSGDDTTGLDERASERISSEIRRNRVDLVARHADSLLAERSVGDQRRRIDSAWAERARRDSADPDRRSRLDSYGRRDSGIAATTGLHFARELEDIAAQVLDTPIPPNNGWSLFPRYGINPGAKRWGYRRRTGTGDASFFVGGNEPIPAVNNARSEILFNQHTLVTSFGWDIFEAMSSDFAGSNYVRDGLDQCNRTLLEFSNALIWEGSAAHACYGVLNFPRLPRIYSSTAFDGTASADDVVAALNRALWYSRLSSAGTLDHDSVAMGERVYKFLSTTRMGTVSDKTILQYWQDTSGVRVIQRVRELDGAGRNGRSCIFFYSANTQGGVSVALGQDFTMLPPQMTGFSNRVFCYMRFGGLRIPDVGGCTLLEVSVPAV